METVSSKSVRCIIFGSNKFTLRYIEENVYGAGGVRLELAKLFTHKR